MDQDRHCSNETYVDAAHLLQRAGEQDDLETLNMTFRYCGLVGAVCVCRCERCDGLRDFYVAAWRRIVAVYEREGRTWGWNRTSKP